MTYQNIANDPSMVYFGEVLEDDSKYASFLSLEVDTDDYCYVKAMELKINEAGQLSDFYFTEGYYDVYYCLDYDVTTLRRHGPSSYGGGGTTLETKDFVYGSLSAYPEEIPYKIENNFVKEISFSETNLSFN